MNNSLRPEPVVSAQAAGLRYVHDTDPGIRRLGSAKRFRYIGPDGKRIRDRETLEHIKSLVIPPAWTDVWICPIANGHLQATGLDSRGRKQYLYHPQWRQVRDEAKYDRLLAFGQALPRIRNRVARDARSRGLTRERVLAAIVRLLERTLIRIGNEEYAKENMSYGITTLRDNHVKVRGSKVHFEFRGKSGIKHTIDLEDKRLARLIKRCQDLPGQELFQYVDEKGARHSIQSETVNEYLQAITGRDFTAKDFRTWGGTVLALQELEALKEFQSERQAKKNVIAAIAAVAKKLGNTRTICRKCYIHPRLIEAYTDGSLVQSLKDAVERGKKRPPRGLHIHEIKVLLFLQQLSGNAKGKQQLEDS